MVSFFVSLIRISNLKTTAIRESFSCKKKAKYSNDRFLINRFKQNDYTFSLKRLYVFIKTIIRFHQNDYTFLVNRTLLSCCTVLFSFGKRGKSAWLQGYSDDGLWTKLPDPSAMKFQNMSFCRSKDEL